MFIHFVLDFLEKRKNSDLTLFNICGTVILATECTSLEFSNDGWVWKYIKSHMNFTLSRDKKSSCLYHNTQLLLFIASVLHLYSAMKSLSHPLSFGMVFCPAASFSQIVLSCDLDGRDRYQWLIEIWPLEKHMSNSCRS